MAVYHFTIHAYRTWDPDHPRGYTKKGEGYQPPDSDMADQYDRNANQDRVLFDDAIQREISSSRIRSANPRDGDLKPVDSIRLTRTR